MRVHQVLSLEYEATVPLTEMAIETAIHRALGHQTGDSLPRPFVVITDVRINEAPS